jgi:hypothetical protein
MTKDNNAVTREEFDEFALEVVVAMQETVNCILALEGKDSKGTVIALKGLLTQTIKMLKRYVPIAEVDDE